MTKEQLEALGLNEEQIKEVFKLNGIAVNNAKGELETIKAEKETLEGQLDTANEEIEKFKDLDVEGIKAAADEYKAKFEEAQEQAKADIEKLQFDHALENALTGAKARNAKAVKALLDLEGLKFNNGEVVGLGEQIENIKKDNDYLFQGEVESEPSFTAKVNKTNKNDNDVGRTGIQAILEKANIRK